MDPNNFNKDFDTSITGTSVTNTCIPPNYCGHRLPCGYCQIMRSPCVQSPLPNPSITWTGDITCNAQK